MDLLYLYPDIHIWQNQNDVLFFDARDGRKIKFPLNPQRTRVVEMLLDLKYLYCVSINDSCKEDDLFLTIVKEGFGEFLSYDFDSRPISIPPRYFIKNSYSFQEESYNLRVRDYVRTVTINIGGNCKNTCRNCSILSKQIPFCVRGEELSEKQLAGVKRQVEALSSLEKINVIISSPDPTVLNKGLQLRFNGVLTVYYVSWLNVSTELVSALSSGNNTIIKILVDLSIVSRDSLETILALQQSFKDTVIVVFCVTCEEDIRVIEQFDVTTRENVEIKLLFTGKDREHIRQHYLLNEKDLQDLNADDNRIFGNRELNFALFGELIIHSDGTIRLNENTEVIGTIEDDWTEMLNKALNKPNPWLLTRSKTKPCLNCIYRDLCPPIRNLELYLGDKLACADYYKNVPEPDDAN